VQEVQRHPVTRAIMHADFRVVDLKVAISTEVPVSLVGESPLVEKGDAVINQGLSFIQIHGLPGDLPSHFDVDISILDSLDKGIYVRDLPTSSDYTILNHEEDLVVALSQVRVVQTEEEEAAEETATEPELIRKEQEEGDEE
jgi:large subunit ribosomal protein L25